MSAFRRAAEFVARVKRQVFLEKGGKVARSVLFGMKTDWTKQCVKLDGFLC